jgi:Protein of unknown function (DUF1036)
MTSILSRVGLVAPLCATVLSVALIGASLAQPPKPGGGGGGPSGPSGAPAPGGGGPGPGGGGPGPGGGGPGPGGGGPGPGGGGPGGGTPSPTFVFEMCNKANDGVVYVAVAGATGQQFRAQGWAQIPQGQCARVGTCQRPKVWFHARATNGVTWGKAEVDLCVNLNGGFDYTWDGSPRTCGQGEMSVPFASREVPPQSNSYTLDLNP